MNVKNVVINRKEASYYLFDNGDLYNYKNHQISTGTINHGYVRYQMTVDGESINIFKHRLLAELFIENDAMRTKSCSSQKWAAVAK